MDEPWELRKCRDLEDADVAGGTSGPLAGRWLNGIAAGGTLGADCFGVRHDEISIIAVVRKVEVARG